MSDPLFLYPQVHQVKPQAYEPTHQANGEFEKILDQKIQNAPQNDLKDHLKFSAHSLERMKQRNIEFDALTLSKIKDAMLKAFDKGVEDALVLTDQGALIVNTKNKTIITALDSAGLKGNIFTNIDGAVIV
jgi:flagellar operon protein